MTHVLKCDRDAFDAVWNGEKSFEVRKYDRNYCYGDRVILRRYLSEGDHYFGPCIEAGISYVLFGGNYGLPEDLCVFAMRSITKLMELPKDLQ